MVGFAFVAEELHDVIFLLVVRFGRVYPKIVGHVNRSNYMMFDIVVVQQLVTTFVTSYYRSKSRWSHGLNQKLCYSRISEISLCSIAHSILQN